MKLRTLIPVTFNKAGRIVGQETEIVVGQFTSKTLNADGSMVFNYTYSKENTDIIHSDGYSADVETINSLTTMLQGSVPTELTPTEKTEMLHLFGFRLKMALTFNINMSDIEIVIPVVAPVDPIVE